MDLEKTAPILCAGITMYSPLMHWGAGSGEKKTVGIVGIGKFNLTSFLQGCITKPSFFYEIKLFVDTLLNLGKICN